MLTWIVASAVKAPQIRLFSNSLKQLAKPKRCEHRALSEMGLEQQVEIRDGVMQIVDELAHRLTKLQGWIARIGVNEFTDQLPLGRNWISGDMRLVNEIADRLGSNRVNWMNQVDEIPNEMTKILHVKIL
jgi:hypothetical protein